MSKITNINLNGIIYEIGGSGITDSAKAALLQIASKIAYVDEDGQDYYDALNAAFNPPANLASISAVFTQGGNAIYDTDGLDVLRQYLVVTAHYDNASSEVITTYALSGTLTTGTSTITVEYGNKSTTFTVTVTHMVSEETLSISQYLTTYPNGSAFNSTTFEIQGDSNYWAMRSEINASRLTLNWDITECAQIGMAIAQFDRSGNPDKMMGAPAGTTSTDPIMDGSIFDTAANAWNDAGSVRYTRRFGGGNIAINLPSDGMVVLFVYYVSGAGGTEVYSNSSFKQWCVDGGLTIKSHV